MNAMLTTFIIEINTNDKLDILFSFFLISFSRVQENRHLYIGSSWKRTKQTREAIKVLRSETQLAMHTRLLLWVNGQF